MSGRRRRTALWSATAVAGVTICLVAVLATRSAGENTTAASPLLGKPAPAIDSTSLGGAKVSLASYRGRYVVLNFFASWCQPCQLEEPQLVEFVAQHQGASAPAVLGVVFSDSAGNAAAFARSNGVTWPLVTDPAGLVALAYGVANPPDSFLVAPDGRVVAHVVGGVTASGLDQLIAESEEQDQ
jgi:cytochrome c biogenesis protein CcmG/thiol:disulfide interchange protein DsbE